MVKALAPFTKPNSSLVLSNHVYMALQLLASTPAHPSQPRVPAFFS